MARKEKPAPGPDDLVRAGAGAYRSGDGRFEVQRSDQGWFLVDTEQANEFGQQLIHGAFATLDDVHTAIPLSRNVKPLLRSASRPAAAKATTTRKAVSRKPAPAPSWIERLPAKEAAEVRRLIRALAGAGIADAESLVRRDRDSSGLALGAAALIEVRLEKLVEDTPEGQRDAVRLAVQRVVGILTDEGAATARPLPRWELVETPRDAAQPPRKIRVRL